MRLSRGRRVTAAYLHDPKPERAGCAPDCEDSRRAADMEEAYRLLGKPVPPSGYNYVSLADVRAQRARLAPRRYVPPHLREAAE
jgi:hypothetical protein